MSDELSEIDLSQFFDLFVSEGQDYVHALDRCLLALERHPDDTYALEAMFRAVHSLKGSAASMGQNELAQLAHATEDVLQQVCDGHFPLRPVLVNLLFAAIDELKATMNLIGSDETEAIDVTGMIRRLQSYDPGTESEDLAPAGDTVRVRHLTEPLHEPATGLIRIDVQHLNTLLDVVTEMVIHRSLMNRLGERYGLEPLNEALQIHGRMLSQLQNAVLKMRMIPLARIFDRFPRMVRDTLKQQGKEARFITEGETVRLDRSAVETLVDPLTHLLRNAIAHGLETPEERRAAGKSPLGTVCLAARQEQDSVIIELSDDGRGIDREQVAAAAIKRSIVTPERVAEMTDPQVLEMICHPGFSLSETVTTVAGRGVGMNVVKREIEALRGSLQIATRPGQGTTFRLQFPAMLALMRALVVRVGDERYALPAVHVDHVISLEPGQVESDDDRELVRTPAGVLPLRRLSRLLHVPRPDERPRRVLVIKNGDQAYGLGVDDVLGNEEIVAKPLPSALRGLGGLTGATILGEGEIVLILDVLSL